MSKKTWLRILVPVMILAVAAGMWLYKDHQEKQKVAQQLAVAGNPAFVLEETTFDLATYQAHGLPLILDFGAEECGPCQVMRPDLEKAHQDTLGKAVIKFFDVWKRPELSRDYPIRVVPTQVFITAEGKPYVPSESMKGAGLAFSMYNHRDTDEHLLTLHEGMLSYEDFQLILKDMGMAT